VSKQVLLEILVPKYCKFDTKKIHSRKSDTMHFQLKKQHRRYAKYKDTGIAWLEKVPEGWETKKLKFLSSKPFQYGANEAALEDDKSQPRFVRITDVDKNGNLKDDTFKSLDEKTARNFLLEDGDILFARSGATVGKTFQYKNSWGKCCFAGYLIKFSPNIKKVSSNFIKYFISSTAYESWKNSIFIQATIQNISAEKYKNFTIVLPSTIEQTAIADYLDEKTALLDSTITAKKKQIKLLKERRIALINKAVTQGINEGTEMKESGVEWIGKVPKVWDVKKLKYCLKLLDNRRRPLSGEERSHMSERAFDYYGASGIIDKVEDFIFDEDLILVAEDGANLLSRSTPLAFIARGKYWVNNHAHILKPLKQNSLGYLGINYNFLITHH
jgi:restriction endonuclease S subunit